MGKRRALLTCGPHGTAGQRVLASWFFLGPPVSAGAGSIPRWDSCKKPQNPVHGKLGTPARPWRGGIRPSSPAPRAGERPGTGGVSGGAAGTPGCVSSAGVLERFQLFRMRPHPSSPQLLPLGRRPGAGSGTPGQQGTEGSRCLTPPRQDAILRSCCFPENKTLIGLLYSVMKLI